MEISHEPSQTLEYNLITDGIYIGTSICCQIHFNELLKEKEGIEVDISLQTERIDAAQGIDFFLWLPVKNLSAPTQEQLSVGVSTIEKFVSLGKKIYVHCMNGHGRAPTLVAAYLVAKGKSVDEAIEFIKSKRPMIHLEDEQIDVLNKFSS